MLWKILVTKKLLEKLTKKGIDKQYFIWKGYNKYFNSRIYKSRLIQIQINIFRNSIRVELHDSNYTRKSDVKSVYTFSFKKKKVGLASVKSYVDKLDIDKLKTLPARLNNLNADEVKLDITKLQTTPVDLKKLVMLQIMALSRKEYLIGQVQTFWIRK